MKESILKLKDVAYRYSDAKKDEYVFKNINYEFQNGQLYAIKGKSGSGKTTLLSLISGLEKKYEGQINFKDQDLSKLDLDKYRNSSIGIVFQSYNLLPHLTASENIILSMDINHLKGINKKQKAIELLKSVGLKENYANRRILKLSGGEQQRVAIARAMLRNAPIVILDEATSALDNESEAIVQKAMDNLMQNRTVFIIAHRLSTIKNADRIAVINEGELVELGTHDELMSIENGQYKALYDMQFKKQEVI